MKPQKRDWYYKWCMAVEKYCNFILVLLCLIPTGFLNYKIAEFTAINYIHSQEAWENNVRLVHPTRRNLSDGSQLTMPEYVIYFFMFFILSALAFLFWTFIFTYLNMKLHRKRKH